MSVTVMLLYPHQPHPMSQWQGSYVCCSIYCTIGILDSNAHAYHFHHSQLQADLCETIRCKVFCLGWCRAQNMRMWYYLPTYVHIHYQDPFVVSMKRYVQGQVATGRCSSKLRELPASAPALGRFQVQGCLKCFNGSLQKSTHSDVQKFKQ